MTGNCFPFRPVDLQFNAVSNAEHHSIFQALTPATKVHRVYNLIEAALGWTWQFLTRLGSKGVDSWISSSCTNIAARHTHIHLQPRVTKRSNGEELTLRLLLNNCISEFALVILTHLSWHDKLFTNKLSKQSESSGLSELCFGQLGVIGLFQHGL